ncbi:MAG: ABC transporter ATP-binding protein [Acidimicrobiales bacterium]|nr:ABC transporter ATP-binding protein [Acidimicrobiaceae bacterium]MXZ15318.1 ABC transporter ATP-binding protein [Acidimicrobiales bacterium]MYA24834.1 ABC transporter ATP-binding protein [Acidimicrobiales bacterium]MYA81699.1 ABC transporter ATP-binding protein [Acidimicrobiales bacterium]MYD83615.1 ABC transporter ATP-binding protein [Acidimicrobiales bacterium]
MNPAAPAIELRDVSKRYAGSPPVIALDRVTVQICQGEMVAVVGQSGSGKSTMLHVMGTLDQPTSGSVLIEGIDTSALPDDRLAAIRGRRVGFVFQRFFLLPGIPTIDNVANGLLYTGTSRSERRTAAEAVLDRVGLGDRMWHRPNELSGGETQRVAVARALVHRPAFILADEPTGNLDSASSASIMDLFHSLHSEGRTIVIVTHNESIAAALPRRLHILDGRLERDVRGSSGC